MFPLSRQIQIATDSPGRLRRLAASSAKICGHGKDSREIKAPSPRRSTHQEFKPSQIDGSEERDITLTIGGQPQKFKGEII